MAKRMKRWIALLLVFVLMLSNASVTVFATELGSVSSVVEVDASQAGETADAGELVLESEAESSQATDPDETAPAEDADNASDDVANEDTVADDAEPSEETEESTTDEATDDDTQDATEANDEVGSVEEEEIPEETQEAESDALMDSGEDEEADSETSEEDAEEAARTEELKRIYGELYDLLGLENEMYDVDYPGKITDADSYVGWYPWDVYSALSYADLTLMSIHNGYVSNPDVKAKLDEYGWFSYSTMDTISAATSVGFSVYRDLLNAHATDVFAASVGGYTVNWDNLAHYCDWIKSGSKAYPTNTTDGEAAQFNSSLLVSKRVPFNTSASPYNRIFIGSGNTISSYSTTWAYDMRTSMEIGLESDGSFSGTAVFGSGAFPTTAKMTFSGVQYDLSSQEWMHTGYITYDTAKYDLMSVILGVSKGMGISVRDARDVATHTLLMNASLGWIQLGSDGKVYGKPIMAVTQNEQSITSLTDADASICAEMINILVRVEAYCKSKSVTGSGSGNRSVDAIESYLQSTYNSSYAEPTFTEIPTSTSAHGVSYISWVENQYGTSNSAQLWVYGTNTITFTAGGNMTITKTSKRGSDVAGYDIKLYNATTGEVWTAKTDSNGVGYVATVNSDGSYAITGGSTITGITAGTYDILEVLTNKGAGEVYPSYITIDVVDSSGTSVSGDSWPKTYYSPGGTELSAPVVMAPANAADGTITLDNTADGNARLNNITISESDLTAGKTIVMTINNDPYHVSATIKKTSSNGASVSDACFKIYRQGSGDTWYVKTNSSGDGYAAAADYTITSTKGVDGLTNGTYSIIEDLDAMGLTGKVFPTSWTITVYNSSGTAVNTKTYTYAAGEIKKENDGGTARLASVTISGIARGGYVTMTINNEPITGTAKVVKTTSNGGTKTGWKFGVYSNSACTTQVGTITTASDGTGTLELSPGTYYVKETGHTTSSIWSSS